MTFRRYLIAFHDLLTAIVALFGSFLLRWGTADFADRLVPIGLVCLATTPVAVGAFWLFRVPHAPWKYVSIADMGRAAAAAAIPAVFLALVDFIARGQVIVPRTVPVIYWLVQVALLIGPRVAYRVHRTRRRDRRAFGRQHRVPILIAGTDDEGDALIRRLRSDAVSSLEPAGLLTTKPRDLGGVIHGVPILGRVSDLASVVESLAAGGVKVRRIVLTRGTLRSAEVDELLGAARRLGLAAVRVSDVLTDVDPAEGPIKLAPVSIDDLLGRPPRELDLSPVRALVGGRDVLVTGAGGSIGAELCRQIAAMGPRRLLLLEQSELGLCTIARELRADHPGCALTERLADVRDAPGLDRTFAEFRPQLVFHAAALKHVDIVELHPVAAAATNTLGTANVARAARANGALCAVFISTDKAVEPVSILGTSKRAGELVFAAADLASAGSEPRTRFLSVRFGNVLGSSGSVIPLFADQLRRGGPVTVTHPEVERYFMTISEAVRLVLMASAEGLQAAALAPTYVLDMGEPIRIVDLATRMIRLAGLEPGVDVAITFSGLRPGERLTELLESAGEALQATAVPGVRGISAPPPDLDRVGERLAALEAAVRAQNDGAVRTILRQLAPEGRPSPSAPASVERRRDGARQPRLRIVK